MSETYPSQVHVAINAQIDPEQAGGIQTSCNSLIQQLQQHAGAIQLSVLTKAEFSAGYRTISAQPDAVHAVTLDEIGPLSDAPPNRLKGLHHALPQGLQQNLQTLTRSYRRSRLSRREQAGPANDRLLQALGINVLHFAYPRRFAHSLPYVFEPHDLQHEVMPEYFSQDELTWRKAHYRSGCRDATYVVCGSQFTKSDIVRFYQVNPEQVAVIPRSTISRTGNPADTRRGNTEPQTWPDHFALYPAATYPHKNHQRLIEAMARIRGEEGVIPILCTGIQTQHYPQLAAEVDRLELGHLIRFTGALSADAIRQAYAKAQLLVFPSLYEGSSQALLEALTANLQIVAAQQTSNPETLGAAADYFDGLSVADMASTLLQNMRQPKPAAEVAAACKEQLQHFDWSRAITTFTALYKHAANTPLSAEENNALNAAISS